MTHSHALTPLDTENLVPRVPSPPPLHHTNPFDAPPHDALPSPTSPMSPLSPAAALAARSYASSSASSAPSGAEERFRFGSGSETSAGGGGERVGDFALFAPSPIGLGTHGRADSATSLESMGAAPLGASAAGARPARDGAGVKLRAPREMQRFQLVDEGPVPRPEHAHDDAASSFVGADEWQECE